MNDMILHKTYIASVEIAGCKNEPYIRREQLGNLLYGIIEEIFSKTGLEKNLDYLFIKYEGQAMIRLPYRSDATEIVDLATLIMLRSRQTELDGKVKIAIHHDHVIKFSKSDAQMDLPFCGPKWAFAVRSSAQPSQIVMSNVLRMELSKAERIAPRLRPLGTHNALMGLEEELYELEWAAEQEAGLLTTPLPKSLIPV